jgi:hypothetical protein
MERGKKKSFGLRQPRCRQARVFVFFTVFIIICFSLIPARSEDTMVATLDFELDTSFCFYIYRASNRCLGASKHGRRYHRGLLVSLTGSALDLGRKVTHKDLKGQVPKDGREGKGRDNEVCELVCQGGQGIYYFYMPVAGRIVKQGQG